MPALPKFIFESDQISFCKIKLGCAVNITFLCGGLISYALISFTLREKYKYNTYLITDLLNTTIKRVLNKIQNQQASESTTTRITNESNCSSGCCFIYLNQYHLVTSTSP